MTTIADAGEFASKLYDEVNAKIAETADAVRAAHKVISDDNERTEEILRQLGADFEAAEESGRDEEVDGETITLFTFRGTDLDADGLDTLRDTLSDLCSEAASEMGVEWDGEIIDPGFWEPSTC